MSTVLEAASGLAFFLSSLRGDASVMAISLDGVHFGAAPVGARFPVAIVQFQSGIDILTANGVRLFVNALYQVKSVGVASDPQPVVDLASRIDDALGGSQGKRHVAVSGGHILSCCRENSLFYEEEIAGVKYMHIGGLYRIQNQQKP